MFYVLKEIYLHKYLQDDATRHPDIDIRDQEEFSLSMKFSQSQHLNGLGRLKICGRINKGKTTVCDAIRKPKKIIRVAAVEIS
jgi:hypothetical protein